MSQDCTDEAGKIIKGSNPFIEQPNQSNAVVDMKGEGACDVCGLTFKLVLKSRSVNLF